MLTERIDPSLEPPPRLDDPILERVCAGYFHGGNAGIGRVVIAVGAMFGVVPAIVAYLAHLHSAKDRP
jgi:hypothetical protein